MDDADVLIRQIRVFLEVVRAVQNNRRRRPRICRHNLGKDEAVFRRHDRHLRIVARVIHPDAVDRCRFFIQRIRQILCRARVVHGRRCVHRVDVRIRYVGQATLAPADHQATRAVLNRIHGGIASARRYLVRIRRDVRDRRHLLRRASHTGVDRRRLAVFHVRRRVDYDQIATAKGVRERTHEGHDPTVFQFARLHELNGGSVGARVVTFLAVENLERRTVGIHAVQVDGIVLRRVVPSAEYDLTVGQN